MFRFLLALSDWLRYSALTRRELKTYALGARGEDLAHRYLQGQGLRVIARNYRGTSSAGELDLIAWEEDRLVFVEVKSRTNDAFAAPERNISPEKRRALFRVAREYARRADVPFDQARFDIVSVVFEPQVQIQHERDVFPILTPAETVFLRR